MLFGVSMTSPSWHPRQLGAMILAFAVSPGVWATVPDVADHSRSFSHRPMNCLAIARHGVWKLKTATGKAGWKPSPSTRRVPDSSTRSRLRVARATSARRSFGLFWTLSAMPSRRVRRGARRSRVPTTAFNRTASTMRVWLSFSCRRDARSARWFPAPCSCARTMANSSDCRDVWPRVRRSGSRTLTSCAPTTVSMGLSCRWRSSRMPRFDCSGQPGYA